MGFTEFITSPAGIAIFCIVAAAIVIFFLAVNYRFFTKNVLDFVFGLLAFIITSPCTAVCAIILKAKHRKVCEKVWICGKGGRPIQVRVFAECGGESCAISHSALKFLPMLTDVMAGRMSLVGPAPLTPADCTLLPEEYEGRFAVRPGILSQAHGEFASRPAYDEMFASDCEYAKKHGLFSDIARVFVWLFRTLRGEGYSLLTVGGYSKSLLSEGTISAEEYENALLAQEEELKALRRSKMRVGYVGADEKNNAEAE